MTFVWTVLVGIGAIAAGLVVAGVILWLLGAATLRLLGRKVSDHNWFNILVSGLTTAVILSFAVAFSWLAGAVILGG